jgi:hypothetical protein
MVMLRVELLIPNVIKEFKSKSLYHYRPGQVLEASVG